jgi:phosphate transport system permease protein
MTRLLGSFCFLSVMLSFLIVGILFYESKDFFTSVSLGEFFFTTHWSPLMEPKAFGLLPLLWGTFFIACLSCLISLPCGILVALYLSQYATPRIRGIIKPALEILAGIPSIVFGYFALNAISPLFRSFYPEGEIFQAASAACVVGIMTLPLVASLGDDALSSVPKSLLQGGYALGATRAEVELFILIPFASSGLIAAFMLAFSRAIGETMAVTLAAGSTPQITLNPFESVQTMTAYMVQVGTGDTPRGSLEYQSLFAVGLVLFLITLAANTGAYFMKRYFKKGLL